MQPKLVRDRIPELIAADGRFAEIEVLDGAECTKALIDKLAEETAELATELGVPAPAASRVVAELADLVEVVRAIAAANGSDLDAVLAAAERKRADRAVSKAGFTYSVHPAATARRRPEDTRWPDM